MGQPNQSVDEDAPTTIFLRGTSEPRVPAPRPDTDPSLIEEGDTGVRRFARRIATALAEILQGRASLDPADVSRRRGKEMRQWRREQGARERSDPTQYEDQDGESSWSTNQATELLGILKAKKKQSK